MREIHDGVGSQLVGLMGAVRRPGATSEELQAQVRGALDEMRMAVDSMQPISGDLATLFATLRYRLDPRLLDVGITPKWHIGDLPQIHDLPPQVVLNLQRIVLEVVTNVLKHAGATSFRVEADAVMDPDKASGTLVLIMTDDGKGFDPAIAESAPPFHQGMRSLRARAELIGAALIVAAGMGGSRIELRWPYSSAIRRAPIAVDPTLK
jgi:signal transduction histidine kinase